MSAIVALMDTPTTEKAVQPSFERTRESECGGEFEYNIRGRKFKVNEDYGNVWRLSLLRVSREANWPHDDVRAVDALLQKPQHHTMILRDTQERGTSWDWLTRYLAYARYDIRSLLQGEPAHGHNQEDWEEVEAELRQGLILAGMVYEGRCSSYHICHLASSPRAKGRNHLFPHVFIDALRTHANLTGRSGTHITVDERGVDQRTTLAAVQYYLKL